MSSDEWKCILVESEQLYCARGKERAVISISNMFGINYIRSLRMSHNKVLRQRMMNTEQPRIVASLEYMAEYLSLYVTLTMSV